MTTRAFVLSFCGFTALGLASAITAQRPQEPGPAAPAYLLRAPSTLAKQINGALARVSKPMEVVIPGTLPPSQYLATLCAAVPDALQVTDTNGRVTVTMPPCLRVRRNVRVAVTAGDTLEGLTVLQGLPRETARSYKIVASQAGSPTNPEPGHLRIGDVVLFPEVPVWTNVVADPALAPDREAMVKAIAAAVDCKEPDPEKCLAQRGIELLNRASVPKKAVFELEPTSAAAARAVRAEALVSRIDTPIGATQPARPAPSAPTSVASGPPPGNLPVAPEQWPYDRELLARILKEDGPFMNAKTIIGIADGGLGNANGGPLPVEAFLSSRELREAIQKQRKEPNTKDDDQNEWVDDLYGGGVPRHSLLLLLDNGHIGLCESDPPSFQGWPLSASHGAAVASIAAARSVRLLDPTLSDTLPKLMFYRMVAEACDPTADLSVAEGDLNSAFNFLIARHANIISISYKIDRVTGNEFKRLVKDVLPQKTALLFLPAPEDFIGDLDDPGTTICPACLGNTDPSKGGAAAKRTIVVGAATRELRRAPFSSYGENTVKLFAPGDPGDAIDLGGQPLPVTEAATSWAAPYAALAAALIRSFGPPNDYEDIRDRLEAATWPLEALEARTDRTGVGVVDLVKAAAVRRYAVEVKELDGDGVSWVRRTYVGMLDKPLEDYEICSGRQLKESRFHAIRLGDPDAQGNRALRLYRRNVDPRTQRRESVRDTTGCRSSGELGLTTIDGQSKRFPISTVTFIQTPWSELLFR